MPEEISPEEKLLRLIRKKTLQAAEGSVSARKKEGMGLAGRIAHGKSWQGGIQLARRFLLLASLILTFYIVYELLFVKTGSGSFLRETKATYDEDAATTITVATPKPYEYYSDQIEKRDIFESPLYRVKPGEGIKPAAGASEFTKNLRLVGIVLDENAEAIIEDLDSKETLFLHKGESIKEALVYEIQESKVILIYHNQRVELTQ